MHTAYSADRVSAEPLIKQLSGAENVNTIIRGGYL